MNGSESMFEICSCRASSEAALGFGISMIFLKMADMSSPISSISRPLWRLMADVDDREVGLLVGNEAREEVERLVNDVVDARRRLVDLVDDDQDLVAKGQVLQDESRLRQGLLGVQQKHAVDHAKHALNFATKVRVARVSTMFILIPS